jgi:hypothetical protein
VPELRWLSQQLREVLPAIADHFGVDEDLRGPLLIRIIHPSQFGHHPMAHPYRHMLVVKQATKERRTP